MYVYIMLCTIMLYKFRVRYPLNDREEGARERSR